MADNFDYFIKYINKNFSDFKNNIKSVIPEINKVSQSVVKLGEVTEDTSSYQTEINKIKELTEQTEKYKALKSSLFAEYDTKEEKQNVQNLADAYEETIPVLEKMGLNTAEFSNIFTSTFDKMLDKSESFSDSMKNMLNDLRNYFIKTIAKSLSESIINSNSSSQNFFAALSSQSSEKNSGFNVFGLLKSFLGVFSPSITRHSGGVVPSGTGMSLPGTAEYLAVLKGGERVLSPSENANYNNGNAMDKKNVVVNNFNIKAWDSKDVQKYLLDNKNLIANITADNIKYNNANLRYMIGGA